MRSAAATTTKTIWRNGQHRPPPAARRSRILDDSGASLPQDTVVKSAFARSAISAATGTIQRHRRGAHPDGFSHRRSRYLDSDGYLFIVDRKKDLIIRGGENIACIEVEARSMRIRAC